MTKQKPISEVRLGRITAAIWKNETAKGIRYGVTISRLYKDGDEWKRSDSFGRDDLQLLQKVADLAHSKIFELQGEANESNEADSDAA